MISFVVLFLFPPPLIKKHCRIGSYAKGKAKENSNIDLFISTDLSGLKYDGLVEELREYLIKRIDLVTMQQSADNMELIDEVLREGIKIYGESQIGWIFHQ